MNMGENKSISTRFEEKVSTFTDNMNSFVQNNKIPGWFKPFIDQVKKFSKDVATTFGELEGVISVQEAVTKALSTDRDRLLKDLHEVEKKLEDQCQYSRRNQLLIHGLDETDGPENTTDVVLDVLKDIGINDISKKDVNRSHRLGQKQQNVQW